MADTLTSEHRSWLMSRVWGRDTKPEWILRSALHRLGFRYRLANRKLPGKPDLVFRKYQSVVFVHGCFWHRHPGCLKATTPKSNVSFWQEKFSKNVERDKKNYSTLVNNGWKVIVVWQCELYNDTLETINRIVRELLGVANRKARSTQYSCCLQRDHLLRLADDKVQYRLRKESHVGQ
jgi:DNA mismatch endonuclease, patch repair protein